MKYVLDYTAKFKKQYKKVCKVNKKVKIEMKNIINILQFDLVFPEKYKNHKLHGKLSNLYECHVKSDWLLIYEKDQDRLILILVKTGTHSELFE